MHGLQVLKQVLLEELDASSSLSGVYYAIGALALLKVSKFDEFAF